MPPKKGTKAKATPAKAAATVIEAPATVTSSKGKEYEATAAAGRPRRESAAVPNTSAPRAKKTATTAKKAAPVKKAAAAKATTTTTTGKKRGRPAKAAVEAEEEEEEDDAPEPPRKRGRPSKAAVAAEEEDALEPPKKKGRPAKAAVQAEEDDAPEPPKKRGRPAKAAPAVDDGANAPKKRGQAPKGGETTKIAADDDAAAEQLEEELVDQVEGAEDGPSKPPTPKRGRGRLPKGKGKAKVAATSTEDAAEDVDEDDGESAPKYWLMKAEQEDRLESLKNGGEWNAKFTIDDLRAKGGPEPWDGVRNVVACKNMKDMKLGDLAFFYASGGKGGNVPGIVGIMEIVREVEVDTSAFDENGSGYVENAKQRGTEAKPKWFMVHVEYRKKLSKPVTLKELQKYAVDGGVLSTMQAFKQTRLSVSKVEPEEWDFITEKLIEGYEEGDADEDAELPNGTAKAGAEDVEMADGDVDDAALPNGPTITTDAPEIQQTIEDAELPTTDSLALPPDTAATSSRPASRAGSRKPASRPGSVKPPSRAGSLAPPGQSSRGRSRTPSVRPASSTQPMAAVTEEGGDGLGAIGE